MHYFCIVLGTYTESKSNVGMSFVSKIKLKFKERQIIYRAKQKLDQKEQAKARRRETQVTKTKSK